MGRTATARARDIAVLAAQPSARSSARSSEQEERRAIFLDFFKDPPADVLAAADAVGRARERYGDATGLERADIEAERRAQQKTKPSRR